MLNIWSVNVWDRQSMKASAKKKVRNNIRQIMTDWPHDKITVIMTQILVVLVNSYELLHRSCIIHKTGQTIYDANNMLTRKSIFLCIHIYGLDETLIKIRMLLLLLYTFLRVSSSLSWLLDTVNLFLKTYPSTHR